MSSNNVPINPAAVTLMAGIIAESISKYSVKIPSIDLSSITDIRSISENVAADMITAVAALALEMPGSPLAATSASPQKRASAAYKKNQNL